MEVSREYFWGCELNKENPSLTWSFEEEEGDSDYLLHTLFLKHAVLGISAVENERNIVEVETTNFDNKTIKHPIVSLTNGRNDMCTLDLSFGHESPVTFRLVEGNGPVHLTAQQVVDFPDEGNISQDESEVECVEDEDLSAGEEEVMSPVKASKSKKRKATTQTSGKTKKGKVMEVSEPLSSGVRQITRTGEVGQIQITFQPREDEEEEEDEDEEMEDEEETSEEEDEDFEESEESSPEKGKKKKAAVKKGKEKPKPAKKAKKQETPKSVPAKKKKVGKK